MLAYEFYSVDKRGEPRFFAILPERRKNPGRITEKSIRKWGRTQNSMSWIGEQKK